MRNGGEVKGIKVDSLFVPLAKSTPNNYYTIFLSEIFYKC